jgi:hypothetical protein
MTGMLAELGGICQLGMMKIKSGKIFGKCEGYFFEQKAKQSMKIDCVSARISVRFSVDA